MSVPPSQLPWVQQAQGLPIAFAQVREDAELDLRLCQHYRQPDIAIIASGGCTVCHLAASGSMGHLHVIDPNPAQLALTQLKLHLLQHHSPAERLGLLGHSPMPRVERQQAIASICATLNLDPVALGPPDFIAEYGADFAGRYEAVFTRIQTLLQPVAKELRNALQNSSPDWTQQGELLEQVTSAMRDAFDLPILVTLFGSAATANPKQPFADHFIARLQHALTTLPTHNNPYLWQVLCGHYPTEQSAPWLAHQPCQKLPAYTFSNADMRSELNGKSEQYDVIHLSNILDWLSVEDAAATLDSAWSALRPGGIVVIRQLNSSLNIRAIDDRFLWLDEQAQHLHQQDRSFFYADFLIGKKT